MLRLSHVFWAFVAVLTIFNIGLLILPPRAPAMSPGSTHAVSEIFPEETPAEVLFSKFDGREIPVGTTEMMIGVMIDNLSVARPQQAGISQASVVYEALAEGGITRLLLLFPTGSPPRVGPVRSARDYFVSIAEEYGGIYVHAGGSPSALEQLLKSSRLFQLDEEELLGVDQYSFRDHRYLAPHNLFFDVGKVRALAQKKSWKTAPPLQSFCFHDEVRFPREPSKDLLLDFSGGAVASSLVKFHYDPLEQGYLRSYGASSTTPERDAASGASIMPRQVLVQIVPAALIDGDAKERLQLQQVGSGPVTLYQDGLKIPGRWEKKNALSPTRFLDLQGQQMCFHPGQTWIAVLPDLKLAKDL